MRKTRHELEQGWDSSLSDEAIEPIHERPKLDADLLSLQTGWVAPSDSGQAQPPMRLRRLRRCEAAQSEDEEEVTCPKEARVKSGHVNYDAPLYLKAIRNFDENAQRSNAKPRIGALTASKLPLVLSGVARQADDSDGSRVEEKQRIARKVSSRNNDPVIFNSHFAVDFDGGSQKPHSTSTNNAKLPSCSTDEEIWAEWKSKWDFVYDYVDAEKEKIKAEEERQRQQSQQRLLLFSHKHERRKVNLDTAAGLGPSVRFPHTSRTSHRASDSGSGSDRQEDPRSQSNHANSRGKIGPSPSHSKHGILSPLAVPVKKKLPWSSFEELLKTASSVTLDDIPFPEPGEPILGVGASAPEKRKALRCALLRWHPDKFHRVLSKIKDPTERLHAAGLVEAVARRIIAEKEDGGL